MAAVSADDVAAPVPVAQTPVQAAAEPADAAPAVPAVMASAPAAPTVVEAYVLPMDELQRIAQGSGLEWVNSDGEKVAAAQAAIAAEPAPVHVPRERKPVMLIDEGPLVLVETRKDLSQLKLPFEQDAAAVAPTA